MAAVGGGGGRKLRSPLLIKILLVLTCLHVVYKSQRGDDKSTWAVIGARSRHESVEEEEAQETDLVDSQFLLFNRVPKTGSTMVATLLSRLAERKGFLHRRYRAAQPRKLDQDAQVHPLNPTDHLVT